MNPVTLRFIDKDLNERYFKDQFDGLFKFYYYTCILGSLSAFAVLILEFISPFGFGNIKYLVLTIPASFYISYKVIQKKNGLFNLTLASMNILLGLMIDALLLLYLDSNILFMAGQTVALVQFSLLLGTNFISNIIILFWNFSSMVVIDSYSKQYFKSLQTMLILALILAAISYWTNEKIKREFFLLKIQDQIVQNSLDTAFQINIMKCVLTFCKSVMLKTPPVNQLKNLQVLYQIIKTDFFNRRILQFTCFEIICEKKRRIFTGIIHILFDDGCSYVPKNSQVVHLVHFRTYYKQSQRNKQVYEIFTADEKFQHLFKVKVFKVIENTREIITLMIQNEDRRVLQQSATVCKHLLLKLQKVVHQAVPPIIRDFRQGSQLNTKSHQIMDLLNILLTAKNISLLQLDIKQIKVSEFTLEDLFEDIQSLFLKYFQINKKNFKILYPRRITLATDKFLLTHLIILLLMNIIQHAKHSKKIVIQVKKQTFADEKNNDLMSDVSVNQQVPHKSLESLRFKFIQNTKIDISENNHQYIGIASATQLQDCPGQSRLGFLVAEKILTVIGIGKFLKMKKKDPLYVTEFAIFSDYRMLIQSNRRYTYYALNSHLNFTSYNGYNETDGRLIKSP